jgi:hypothetical protein
MGERFAPEQSAKTPPGQQFVDWNEYCQQEHESGAGR